MFRAKSNHYPPCNKHRKHRQSPGVCSICLNDKLSNLSSTASSSHSTRPRRSSSSSLSSLSSSDISSCVSSRMSPMHAIQMRIAYEERASKYSFNWELLGKRDSVAILGRPIDSSDGGDNSDSIHSVKGKEKKERCGFWSKLLISQPRRTRRITNDHHRQLDRVIDRGFMYSQPLIS